MEENMSLLELFKKKGSGDVAKDRLKLLLVSDRANCSPEVMEMIKNDIIKVISKYMQKNLIYRLLLQKERMVQYLLYMPISLLRI